MRIIKTKDLASSAKITLTNMQTYYDMYDVDWGLSDVHSAIEELENLDVYDAGGQVGVVRLAYTGNSCLLRDIQVVPSHQNKGLGALIIARVAELAKRKQMAFIDLRVFKLSPACRLYKRLGFVIESEDDKFYQMRLALT